jgi:UDP-N-acetylmuramate--alanine ligase
MQTNLQIFEQEKIFFIGIGGVSMSALALYLKSMNLKVGGSDQTQNSETLKLKNSGVEVFIGHDKNNIKGYTTVVYTSAIDNLNPELTLAKQLGLKILKRSELLGLIVKQFKNSIAVCGSHGKTTTTSMLTCAFNDNALKPTAFIGGDSASLNNLTKGDNGYVILEACEYKKNFLDIKPTVSVVLNIDDDHVDTFSSDLDRYQTFSKFTENTLCFYNKDDIKSYSLSAKKLISFGIKSDCDYLAVNIRKKQNGYSFTVRHNNQNLVRVNLKVLGRHNVYNALACVAVSHYLNLNLKLVKFALEDFSGVKRRNEYLGSLLGLKTFADYAHHPTEIKAYLDSQNNTLDKSIVIFQPHTFSRTKALKEKFVKVLLKDFDLIIYKTYPAREKFDKDGSAKSLYSAIKDKGKQNVYYKSDKKGLLSIIKFLKKGKKRLYVVGAGDIYQTIKDFIN